MQRILRLLLVATILLDDGAAYARPLVAILAQNGGTEVTDFLVPYAVLASADVADVVAVSTADGPVALHPALTILADTTLASFDRAHPEGASVVVVPAFHDPGNALTRDWLRAQAGRGAMLVSICDGALTLAGTGLLDGHRATGYFASAARRRKEFPRVDWQDDARFVHDGRLLTSSGVSASLPASLYLVELLAGRERAVAVARAYGVAEYGPRHDSHAFHLGAAEYWLGARGLLFAWPRDVYAIHLTPGVDEVALGFAADMLGSTYRANVVSVSETEQTRTRHGLRVLRDRAPDAVPARAIPVHLDGSTSAGGLVVGAGARAPEDVLAFIARRYGEPVAGFVATQLEYPRSARLESSLPAH